MPTATNTKSGLTYKGRPLRRLENLIYYGSMQDEYIIMLQISETEKVNDLEVPKRVTVQLQLTDPSVKSRERVIKQTEKTGFYEAIDVAAVWLERALAGKLR